MKTLMNLLQKFAESFAESFDEFCGNFFAKRFDDFCQNRFSFPAMHKLKSFQIPFTILASLIAQSTFAQTIITSFFAEDLSLSVGGHPTVYTSGSFPIRHFLSTDSTVNVQVDLNEGNLTATFKKVEFNVETINFERNSHTEIPDGFGAPQTIQWSNTISGTIDFDPIVFQDDQSLSMTRGGNGWFAVNDFTTDNLPSTDQNRLSGTYEFSGPTESVEGTFSFNPNWRRWQNPSIDTTDFPNEVIMSGGPEWFVRDQDFHLVSETIDGVDISVGIPAVWLRVPQPMSMQIIPEPSTYAFAIGLLLIAFVGFRRRGFVKSS